MNNEAQRTPIEAAFMRALGNEIRLVREARGLDRTQFIQGLDADIVPQALANYERGIRSMTVFRFVQICNCLDVSALDLLSLALQRAQLDLYSNMLLIDLQALTADKHPSLRPLRTWAKSRLAQDIDGSGIARLSQHVVEEFALLHGMDRTEFVRVLLPFTPSVAPRWWWPSSKNLGAPHDA